MTYELSRLKLQTNKTKIKAKISNNNLMPKKDLFFSLQIALIQSEFLFKGGSRIIKPPIEALERRANIRATTFPVA